MPFDFHAEVGVLVGDLPVAVLPTPGRHPLQRPVKAVPGRLAFDDPVVLSGTSPVVCEPQEIKRVGPMTRSVGSFALTLGYHPRLGSSGRQLCWVGVVTRWVSP